MREPFLLVRALFRRRWIRAGSAVLAATAMVLGMTAASASAAPAATAPAALTAPGMPHATFNPALAKCHTVTSVTGATKRCTEAQKLPLSVLTAAQQAERRTAMAKLQARAKAQSKAQAAKSAAAASPLVPPLQCDFSGEEYAQTGVAFPDRFTSCADVVWTIWDVEYTDGTPIITGLLVYEDQSWVSLAATSVGWTHGMDTIGYTEGSFGDLSEGITGELASGCVLAVGICEATSLGVPDPQPATFAPGTTESFGWAESDDGPAASTSGAVDVLDPYLGYTLEFTTPVASSSLSELGYLSTRCDSQVGATPGCVDQNYTPILPLPIATYGASAAMIEWAQTHLAGAWGLLGSGEPLNRLADTATATANRGVICDSTFTNLGTAIGGNDGDSDSCDEFPFAATYQSAAFTGAVTSGSQCAQVQAVQTGTSGNEAADWASVKVLGSYNTQQPCVRGHIPLELNGDVGRAYGRFTTAQRLIDFDQFWVSVF